MSLGTVPGSNRTRLGYQKLRTLRPEDIIAVHNAVAKVGETWSTEIRDLGSIGHLADRISGLAEARYPPSQIAALALHFVVREHPFWDANHRTGFELAQIILRTFGLRIEATSEEVEAFVRSIDASQLSLKEVERWIKELASQLR
ncbi:MAG: type II toxin-antitoxin system death-on-curing family toxin [Methanobacteriota archaeon]